jgi:hypothetical protein
MVRDNLRLTLGDHGEPVAQHLRDAPVQHLPPTLEQTLVGRLLNQRVLEGVDRVGRLAVSEHQLGLLKLGEP